MKRHDDPDGGGDVARPHAGRQDHEGGGDIAGFRFDSRNAAIRMIDRGNLNILEYLDAALARALGQRHGDVGGVGLGVGGDEGAAQHIGNLDQRVEVLALPGPDHIDPEPEDLGHVGTALEVFQPALVGGDGKRTVPLEAGGLAGFVFQPGVEFGRVLGQLGHVLVVAELPNQPGGVPGGARCQLLALDEHHIGPTDLGQVIGDGTSDDATADDDGLGFFGWCFYQGGLLRYPGREGHRNAVTGKAQPL